MAKRKWYPDNRGWIDHDGGPCPVNDNQWVQCLLDVERCDREYRFSVAPARDWPWQGKNFGVRIVAYKLFYRKN